MFHSTLFKLAAKSLKRGDGIAVDLLGFSTDVSEESIAEYVKSFGEMIRLDVVQDGNDKNARAW